MNIYDYIVIGAGSSGAVLASRLSENPNNNVLLIEAGDSFEKIQEIPDVIKNGMATGADWTGNLAVGTDYDWKYEGVSNEDFKNMGVPRGKVIEFIIAKFLNIIKLVFSNPISTIVDPSSNSVSLK